MTSSATARLARSSALHVGFACLAMGGWAVFANRAHPPAPMLLAGLVQGLLSGAITLVLKRSLEAMAARLSGPFAFVLPPLVPPARRKSGRRSRSPTPPPAPTPGSTTPAWSSPAGALLMEASHRHAIKPPAPEVAGHRLGAQPG